jgi:superfamily II DNA or RNA helicase
MLKRAKVQLMAAIFWQWCLAYRFDESMGFENLTLLRHYDSDEDDLLETFYRPVLSSSISYDRAVGYFSSSTFKICSRELANFVRNDGVIRIVIGCLVSSADIESLTSMNSTTVEHQRVQDEVRAQLLAFIESDATAAILLARLVEAGIATLRFAVRNQGIYHEKFGVFRDQRGLKVAFIGSANETDAALSYGGNHESISVYKSMEPPLYAAYGDDLERRFENLWHGRTRHTRVYDLGAESLALMKEIASRPISHAAPEETPALPRLVSRFELRSYQTDAIISWAAHDYRGILAMATGTGKTLTAIDAVKRFKRKVANGAVIVTVPYQNLAVQWAEALREQGLLVILSFDSYTNWYTQVKNVFLGAQFSDTVPIPCIVCVNDTFRSERFQELMGLLRQARERHHFVIVDECHHFNSIEHIKTLPEHFTFRLGLSATPYDQYSIPRLDTYFGSIVYDFPLGRAINEGFLTPYNYNMFICCLDEDETALYEYLTQKIVQITGSDEGFTPETLARAQPLLLRRARVVGAARDKLVQLRAHLSAVGRSGFNLFYCGDGTLEDEGVRIRQIEAVSQMLHELGWRSSRITAEESLATRENLLERLSEGAIDGVVSIKVLDEGIDIPICRSAYLLASQSSDRQGIQRRGRVLRRAPGKLSAELYDFVVLAGTANSNAIRNLARKELRRAFQFARDASNAEAQILELIGWQEKLGIEIGSEDA